MRRRPDHAPLGAPRRRPLAAAPPFTSILALAVAAAGLVGAIGSARTARAEVAPHEPYAQLAGEVMAFLYSDVGIGGIRTNDNLPGGYPVPPYYYHFGIHDYNTLWSSTTGYPGYASVSYPAYTACVAIDAFLDWHRFSGDARALERARAYADWILEHRTPTSDLYGNLPYSTQTDGVMGGGWDGDAIMTDKPAMFGLRLLRLYDATGDGSYWQGAQEIAATLAATQLAGGVADDGRWPFRVRPLDGAVRQDYTSHFVPAVRFFAEMARRAERADYLQASARAWNWLLSNPCDPASPFFQRWEGFYEDQDPAMQTGKRDHYSAHETIAELIARRPPGWQDMAVAILDTAAARYLIASTSAGLGVYVPATYEWSGWMEATMAATLQFACSALRLHQALAGDPRQRQEWLDWAYGMAAAVSWGQNTRTYASDGRMYTTLKDITRFQGAYSWYEQDFNTVKYYLELMALDPSLAPAGENHLLAATREIRAVSYPPASAKIVWQTAGGHGRELLRVASPPAAVRAGGVSLPELAEPIPPAADPLHDPGAVGWHYDPAAGTLTIGHAADPVEVLLGAVGVADGGEGGDGGACDGGSGSGSGPAGAAVALAAAEGPGGLQLTLAAPGCVSVAVYDVRGRRVATLLAGAELGAGEHAVRWDGRDAGGRRASAGLYLVRARTAGMAAVARLTVVD